MLKIVENLQENQGQFSRYKQGDTKKVEQISKKPKIRNNANMMQIKRKLNFKMNQMNCTYSEEIER